MSMSDIEKQRHMRRKGDILRVLKEDYRATMTSAGSILGALDMLGDTVGPESLQFHLTYLFDSGYIKIWRVRDLPGWRADRAGIGPANEIRFAKLLPKGLQLLDGNIDADPQVMF